MAHRSSESPGGRSRLTPPSSARITSGSPSPAERLGEASAGHSDPLPSPSGAEDVDQVCQRFEAARGSENPLTIAACLEGWEEPERSKLLCELVALELQWRQRANVDPKLEELRQQFPQQHAAVEEAILRHQNINTFCPTVGADRLSIQSDLHHMRFLAEGGLGQVFIAEDQTLRREAAIKLIREDLIHDASSCDQFRLEAEVTGRLDHPGIPVVYGMGTATDGRLFYVMKYVRGTGLDQLIRRYHRHAARNQPTRFGRWPLLASRTSPSHSSWRGLARASASAEAASTASGQDSGPPDLHELLTIFISICHTIGYAHRRGILHRDIKPGNVIQGKYGETVTIDWGLALPVARQGVFKDNAEQTLTPLSGRSSRGSIGCIGTPAFMSPEQAAGNVPLTPASDIFSLGATLYCILTGRPPYQAPTVQEVRQKAIECDHPPVGEVAPTVPPALQAICRKAMRRESSRRYKTTHELIADIHAHLSDHPVSAVKESPYTRLTRWTRHNTNLVLGMMLCAVVLTLGTALAATRKSLALADQKTITNNERTLRENGLKMAADMAAQTVAGKIDLAFRSLELAAQDDDLVDHLLAYNESPDDEIAGKIQSWLNTTVSQQFRKMQYRAWFAMSRDGTTIARFPEYADSTRASSIGRNFAFRDYFHGLGQDLPPGTTTVAPISKPHNASVVFSTQDSELTAYFSVPILDQANQSVGVLAITVDRKTFFDIKTQKPEAQQLLLVETRGYPLLSVAWDESQSRFLADQRPQWSAGAVIHHENHQFVQTFDALASVSPACLKRLLAVSQQKAATPQQATTDQATTDGARLFEQQDQYSDPLETTGEETTGDAHHWTAAFAPVVITTRDDAAIATTGWFVIVQQDDHYD